MQDGAGPVNSDGLTEAVRRALKVPDPHERPTLRVEEAGRFLGLGRNAAYDAVGRGDIPSIRIGRRLVVPTAGLRRLLQLDAES